MTTLEWTATVVSWDDATGTGHIVQDLRGEEEAREVDRSLLLDTRSLAVGQRVAFVEAYEPDPNGERSWRTREVRPITDDRHYWAGVLERLCSAVDHAESDLRVASEAADEDTVTAARAALSTAREVLDRKLLDVADDIQSRCTSSAMSEMPGYANTIYARGMDDALHAVLDRVDQRYRGVVDEHWKRVFLELAEIRAMDDYLPAEDGPD